MRTLALLVLFAATLFVWMPPRVRAQEPQRTAFAVVIGNNRSLGSRRPDLHYADDDAAKYFDIFRTIAPERTFLLADFDRDTARLFPEAPAHASAPTRSELLRVGRELADRVRQVTSSGGQADVYFVFAGHGDVDHGSGFIELADARFTSADLEHWLRAIAFSRAHVILDSCNSFFMLAARKPGGRYYATSEDAARELAQRLPNVGVFLSTSAEGDAFEWSEIQSGVFSHIVRSGLLGAADANGDGHVDYFELAAFVSTATADVANPNMRPHVFSRGPGGHDELAIVDIAGRSGARTLRLSESTPTRIRVRDREGVPFLDANSESGLASVLAIPESWAEGAVLERAVPGARPSGADLFAVPDAQDDLTLAALSPLTARGGQRGPAEIFENLFAQSFGPRAVANYRAELKRTAAPVYGVSREDAERMDLLLAQIAGAEHGQRMVAGTVGLATGAFFAGLGATALAFADGPSVADRRGQRIAGIVGIAAGALWMGYGAYTFFEPWAGEHLALDYRAALGSGGDYARAFALADDQLRDLAEREQRSRWMRGITGSVLVLAGAATILGGELGPLSRAARLATRGAGGYFAVLGLTTIAMALFVESPLQRITDIWRRDPGHLHLQPTLAGVPGGGMVGVEGRF